MLSRGIAALALTSVIAAALASCTPVDPAPDVTPTVQPATPAATPSATADAEAPLPGSTGRPVDAALYAHTDGGVAFASPSGNIQCGYSTSREPGWWWCLLREQSVELPPDPAGQCTGTLEGVAIVPNGLGMTGGDPTATPQSFCAGAGDAPALAYGDALVYREMACDSTEDGMICRSTLNGHGFRLSRSDYETY